jgi:hypothetical protein
MLNLNFDEDKINDSRKVMRVLLFASAYIPLCILYMILFGSPLQVSIFTEIYSSIIVILWVLYYLGIFNGEQPQKKPEQSLQMDNDEVIT